MTSLRHFSSVQDRRIQIEKEIGVSLSSLSVYPEGLDVAQTKHCEQMIGAVQIPVGIAGPLSLNGVSTYATYVPLATTEAALVASVNRGCKAITLSGGARVYVEDVGMSRGPVFQTKSLKESMGLKSWILSHTQEFGNICRTLSSHLTFQKVYVRVSGRQVFVRFSFLTDEAMGMNMVTSATSTLSHIIEQETEARCLAVAGNFDTDKKPSSMNMLLGRGKQTWAEVVLPSQVIKDVLKTTPNDLLHLIEKKCLLGSVMSGSLGYNAHHANIVAAIFLATGQDPAHVVEGSQGITTTDKDIDGISISVHLPSLVIGTIGGGTGLPAQKENLAVMGISAKTQKHATIRLAEIITAAVLAGEISLLASLAEGSLARTHERLAGKKNSNDKIQNSNQIQMNNA